MARATRGCSRDDRLEVPRREREAGRRAVGDDLGRPRSAVEHRQLPEELAGAEVGDRSRRRGRPGRAPVDDDEEARPDLALPGDDVAGRERRPRRRAPAIRVHARRRRRPANSGVAASSSARRSRVRVMRPPWPVRSPLPRPPCCACGSDGRQPGDVARCDLDAAGGRTARASREPHGRPRGTHRCDRRVRAVRGPDRAAARGHRRTPSRRRSSARASGSSARA